MADIVIDVDDILLNLCSYTTTTTTTVTTTTTTTTTTLPPSQTAVVVSKVIASAKDGDPDTLEYEIDMVEYGTVI